MTKKTNITLLFAVLFIFYLALPNLGFAGDGHNHSGESHQSHSDHDNGKKKSKKGHKGKSHDHSDGKGHCDGEGECNGDDHSGHKHDKGSSVNDDAHGENHGHSNEEAHNDEGSHDHDDEEEAHAHAESDGHDGHEGDDHDDHGGGSGIGPGKAITEVKDEGSKFKLSSESVKYLNITSEPIRISGNGLAKVSKKSLVRYQNVQGIYVKVGDWYEIKKVQVVEDNGQEVIIRASNLNSSSKVATSGLGFLRAAHLQASGQGGKGHAH